MTFQHFEWSGRGKMAAVKVGKEEVIVVKIQDDQKRQGQSGLTHIPRPGNIAILLLLQIPHFLCRESRS